MTADPETRPSVTFTVLVCAVGIALIVLFSTGCAPRSEPLPPKVDAFTLATIPEAVIVPATGFSMHPWIPGKDSPEIAAYLAVAPTPYDDLKRGHVVLYTTNSRRIIHRLGSPTPSGWVVYGINNEVKDPARVTKDNYLGQVVAVSVVAEKE